MKDKELMVRERCQMRPVAQSDKDNQADFGLETDKPA
jgi:hypothetical protein